MDIKIPHSVLTDYLKTSADPENIAHKLSLSGPTVDHLERVGEDWLYHIEIITNRIDSASAFGVAREASAILPQFGIDASLENDPYQHSLSDLGDLPDEEPVAVEIQNDELIKRFSCISLRNVSVADSPEKVRNLLTASGQRPLNNVIDITNELTLRYGQPVHVFDLDQIAGKKLILRQSREGESITTLDDKKHLLKGDDIVIEDGNGDLIDLCGIMGGANSQVTENTKNVLLFVQTYEEKRIRTTSLYTQERTLASQIFEKQPDPELVMPVLIEGVKLLKERAGAEVSSKVLDIYPNPIKEHEVLFDIDWLNRFAGISFEYENIKNILTALGFTVEMEDKEVSAQVPNWRINDIAIKEDIAEEIVRVHGYYRLPSVLPPTTIPQTETRELLHWESKAQSLLAHTGFTEVLNYALVSKELFDKAGISLEHAFTLSNPLSLDHAYMRPSLLPSLLETLEANRGKVEHPIRIFELANIYLPLSDSPLSDERSTLALATQGLDYLEAKGHLEALFDALHIKASFIPENDPSSPYRPQQTARIVINDKAVGYLGVLKESVKQNFSLKDTVVVAQLDFETVSEQANTIHHFKKIPEHPPIIEDLTFTLPQKTLIKPVLETLQQTSPLIEQVKIKDTYQRNYTFTIHYRHPESLLSDADVAPIRKQVVDNLLSQYSAVLVGELS